MNKLVLGSRIVDIGSYFDNNPTYTQIFFISTGSGKTMAALSPFFQRVGRVGRVIQCHQEQLEQYQRHFSALHELAQTLIHLSQIFSVKELIFKLYIYLLRVIESCRENIREEFWNLKAAICNLLCIMLIGYIVSALHRRLFTRHFSRYRSQATDEDDSNAFNCFLPGMQCCLFFSS